MPGKSKDGPGTSRLGDATVFVGGPFSSALKFDAAGNIVGFDEALRSKFERVYEFLRKQNAGILSSHLAESFGADVHEMTLVQRDNAWLRACDLYLAVLPFGGSEPYRTDGTFVEIGMAIGIGRPALLLLEKPNAPEWSYYVRNLGAEALVTTLLYDDGEDAWLKAIGALLEEAGHQASGGAHIPEPHTLNSLVYGGVSGHSVRAQGVTLRVPAGALSSRYDASLKALAEAVLGPATRTRRVLAIGGGAGELAFALLSGPDTVATIYEPDEATREALQLNLKTHGLAHRAKIVETPESAITDAKPFDLAAFHAPPLDQAGKGPFAERREKLVGGLRQLLPLVSPTAEIYLAVTSLNQTSDVFEASAGFALNDISPSAPDATSIGPGLWRGVRIQT